MAAPTALRCAIYTRKSSDEGLEQSFNSLHAQREACEAYIKSQTHEGWSALANPYDDGGFSGGSMERPGLAALLADIERGQIDVVVVYKVDRLTRSLMDFARIVEAFDRKHVSFVSVTQAFNTTTSMGRLTLNVLLSFAQFEREVTSERIRDKIAASKKKGMWMGGNLPLGYDRQNNTLVINGAEAEQVRFIFERYRVLGSVPLLRRELAALGYRSKSRVTRKGNPIGGVIFNKGALYHLLSNDHYRGLIRHKDELHAGLHSAIVDEELFEDVQRILANNRVHRGRHKVRAAGARLIGRITCAGVPMSPTFSYGRGRQPYRYYIVPPDAADATEHGAPRRLPAEPVEAFIHETLARLAGKPDAEWSTLDLMLIKIEARAEDTHLILDARALFGTEHPALALQVLNAQLKPGEQAVAETGQAGRLRVILGKPLRFRGGRSWFTDPQAEEHQPSRLNPTLVAGLRNAHKVLREQGIDPNTNRIGLHAQSPVHPYQRRLCLMALLAPDLQRAILEGRTPRSVTLHGLIVGDPPPLLWREQTAWLTQRKAGG